MERYIDRKIYRQKNIQIEKYVDIQIDRQIDGKIIDRKIDRKIDRYIHIYYVQLNRFQAMFSI